MPVSDLTACDDRLPLLVDAADDALDAAARATLDAHLATCPGCRAELAAMRDTSALLATTRNEPDPLHVAGFAARTTEAAETFRDRSLRGFWWALPRPQRFASVFSFASLAAALVLFVAARPDPVVVVPDPKVDVATAEEPPLDEAAVDDAAQLAAIEGDVDFDTGFDTLDDEDLDALVELLETT